MKTREFGQPVARVPQPGRCRICGCTDPDLRPPMPGSLIFVAWADETRTLCENPDCIAEAKREIGR